MHYRPLAADAAVVYAIPAGGEDFVPTRLRGPWNALQKGYFSRFNSFGGEASATYTYSDLVNSLQQVWNLTKISSSDSSLLNEDESIVLEKETVVKVRVRDRGSAKHIQRINLHQSTNAVVGIIPSKDFSSGDIEGIFNNVSKWLVITKQSLKRIGSSIHDAENMRKVQITLPLVLAFNKYDRLPAGVRVVWWLTDGNGSSNGSTNASDDDSRRNSSSVLLSDDSDEGDETS